MLLFRMLQFSIISGDVDHALLSLKIGEMLLLLRVQFSTDAGEIRRTHLTLRIGK